MSERFFWQSAGEGSDLILIHGWGMNSGIWQGVIPSLKQHFRVHWIDLPGFGDSSPLDDMRLETVAEHLLAKLPPDGIWLGWSLGGLIAMKAALMAPEAMKQLITVAATPCFTAQPGWKGVQPTVLSAFAEQLSHSPAQLIERFIALQSLGSPTAKQDLRLLKSMILQKPFAAPLGLKAGLDLLATSDLRGDIHQISVPWLRLYGRLDGLVPHESAQACDLLAPQSQRLIFDRASHAPFISCADLFVDHVVGFCA